MLTFSQLLIEFTPSGIFCPKAGIYIDPTRAVDKAVITHSHSDHARRGSRAYLTSCGNAGILKHRIGASATIEGVEFGEKVMINGVCISLHPAGHVPGSAQVRLEYGGEVCVVTGDYKTESDGLTEEFEQLRCNAIVTESTFALPLFKWNKQEFVRDSIVEWWKRNSANGVTSLLCAYSLGKAQRLIRLLHGHIPCVFVHPEIEKTNDAVRRSGYDVPEANVMKFGNVTKELQGAFAIVPPSFSGSADAEKLAPFTAGYASGWMAVRGSRRSRSAGAGFPLSDHADWNGLNDVVRRSDAERVFVVHGFADAFSRWLNENGINATPVHSGSHRREAETTSALSGE